MNRLFPLQRAHDEMSLSQEVVQLSDNFAEFNKVNAFLCEAFTSVMSNDDPVREEVIQGAKYCAELIQSRSQELKEAIDQLRERCITDDA